MKMRRLMTEVMTWSLLLTVLTAINPLTTLECHRREYSYKAVRTDHVGRQCWDYVKTMSCWGRCDSGEIADWRFPFKKSFHQVCMHEKRRLVTTRLRYCDPGVDQSLRQYTAADAITCTCRLCRSSDASCEGAGSSLVPTSTSSAPVSHYNYNSALPYRRRKSP